MRLNAIAAALAVNVALAGGLAYLWADGERTRWAEPEALPPALEDAVAMAAAEPADVARYRETVERPLFAANRKPAPKSDPAQAQEAADALNDVRLLGTYGAGERGGIVIARGGKVERVAIGESIGKWKVAGGGSGRSAELVRDDGQRRQLELALNNTAPAAPAAAKDGAPAAAATSAEPASSATATPAASRRAAAARGGSGWGRSTSPEARQQALRDRMEKRRAAKGQQPPPESK